MPKRLIVGITGASGVCYGIRLLEILREMEVETHLVLTKAAQITLAHETNVKVKDLYALASYTHDNRDIGASIASGSFLTSGMIVAPCSMRALSAIAHSFSTDLLSRAADVILKEKRQLALMVRETPLHLTHLKNMEACAQMGAIIAPPVPAFYAVPKTLDEMVTHSVGRVLDLFDLPSTSLNRWGEQKKSPSTTVSVKE